MAFLVGADDQIGATRFDHGLGGRLVFDIAIAVKKEANIIAVVALDERGIAGGVSEGPSLETW